MHMSLYLLTSVSIYSSHDHSPFCNNHSIFRISWYTTVYTSTTIVSSARLKGFTTSFMISPLHESCNYLHIATSTPSSTIQFPGVVDINWKSTVTSVHKSIWRFLSSFPILAIKPTCCLKDMYTKESQTYYSVLVIMYFSMF